MRDLWTISGTEGLTCDMRRYVLPNSYTSICSTSLKSINMWDVPSMRQVMYKQAAITCVCFRPRVYAMPRLWSTSLRFKQVNEVDHYQVPRKGELVEVKCHVDAIPSQRKLKKESHTCRVDPVERVTRVQLLLPVWPKPRSSSSHS